jgi:hypothetical protein
MQQRKLHVEQEEAEAQAALMLPAADSQIMRAQDGMTKLGGWNNEAHSAAFDSTVDYALGQSGLPPNFSWISMA